MLADMRATEALGRYGEELAVRTLRAQGMTVIDRNWRCREGEIDVVARDGSALVFCEVKTRRGSDYGTPAAAVDVHKLARLRRLAGAWLAAHTEHALELRIDVVAITVDRGAPRIEHLRGVG